jgi:uroporphyrinogen-III decarboxylase
MIRYQSWEEAKQAIRDETERLLAIGNDASVQNIRYEFDIGCELLPTVEYTVQKVVCRMVEDA